MAKPDRRGLGRGLSALMADADLGPDPTEAASDGTRRTLPIEQVAKRWIVASTPEEVVDGVREYVDMGFNHLVFHAPGHDQDRFLKSFSEQVVPALREL